MFFISLSYADKPLMCHYDRKNDIWECYFPDIIDFGDVLKKLHIIGTEYWYGERAKVYLQLQYKEEIVDNATCLITIFDPDGNIIHKNAPTMHIQGYGIYYYDFPTTLNEGVYMVSAFCSWVMKEQFYNSKDFVLSKGVIVSGSIEDTKYKDNVAFKLKEEKDVLDVTFYFNLTNLTGNYTALTIYSYVSWDGTENASYYIYNFNTSSWEELPNEVYYSPNFVTINNAILQNISNYISRDNQVVVRFYSPEKGGGDNILSIDYLSVGIVQIANQTIESIRGGGEIHLHSSTFTNYTGNEYFWIFEKDKDTITETILQNHDYCYDNQTLAKNLTIQKCINDNCYNYTKIELITCEYGCSNDKCNPSPISGWIIILGIILFVVIILALAYKFL